MTLEAHSNVVELRNCKKRPPRSVSSQTEIKVVCEDTKPRLDE
ncbi:MAG: hypothetical protein ACJA2S_004196 [Cyclobacteriaceae bacterium]|jgi:hypothetical protein